MSRIDRLRALQREAKIDYVAVVPGPNLVYFTGLHMHLSERPCVALFPADPARRPILVLPGFEVGKAKKAPVALDWEIHSYADGQPYQAAFDAALGSVGEVVFGVEPRGLRFLEYSLMRSAAPGASFTSAEEPIKTLRMAKDAGEIAAMRRAIAISERALADLLEIARPGMTERKLAAALKEAGSKYGSVDASFEPLVQSGTNAAYPHGTVTDRAVGAGECLLIDFGFKSDDYPADITRTVFVGQPGDELRRIYDTVKAANAAGRAAVKPGATGQDIDRATRKVIFDAGYGAYFTHRTGHGLGLEGHEPPYMVEGDLTPLRPGMTFTIEPGIYVEGVGGVRIEDNILVTETGGESLTSFERDLLVVG